MIRYLLGILFLSATAFADEAAVKALNPTAWWKSYKGLTVTALKQASAVADQSANARTISQAVAGNQPTVTRGDNRENRLLTSDAPDGWSKLNSGTGALPIVTENVGVNDQGNRYHRLQLNRGASDTLADYSLIRKAVSPATPNHTFSVRAKSNDANSYTLYWHDSGDGPTFIVTPTWQTFTWTTPPTATTYGFGLRGGLGTSAAADVLISECHIRSSLADSTYIVTTTYPEYRGICNTAGNHCLPALHFDGVDDYMTSTATLANIHANNAKTLYALVRPAQVGANKDVIRFSSAQNDWGLQLVASGNWQIQNWDTNSDVAIRPSVVNELALIRVRHDTGNIYISVNGVESAATASGNTGTLTATPFIGSASAGANFFNGDMVELITFDTALSAANQAVVEAYLSSVMSASADPWKNVRVLP